MHAEFELSEGHGVGFAMCWAPAESAEPVPTSAQHVAAAIDDTVEGWRSWESEHDIYDGPNHDLVRFSSRVLKGLTYQPTGAIVAAPTTSLPEDCRAGSATGITATRGSATRASRSRRSTSAPVPRKPRTSSPS